MPKDRPILAIVSSLLSIWIANSFSSLWVHDPDQPDLCRQCVQHHLHQHQPAAPGSWYAPQHRYADEGTLPNDGLECLIYGGKALLWGLPISVVLSYGIYRIFSIAYSSEFVPPWGAMLIASACVFLVVFISMFYAVSKLRKDDPLEAMSMENT